MREAFAARFGRPCEVVARAPGRVNLIGEHVDYNDGFVLPMGLEQSTFVAAARRPDDSARVYSTNLEAEASWPIDGWDKSAQPHWTSYVAGVAALLRRRGASLSGFDLLIRSNVPVGSGLSSSAALEVATGLALVYLCGEALTSPELADLCAEAEREFAEVPCGIMDQYASLFAKPDSALLLDCRAKYFQHIPLRLGEHTVFVIDSGVRHENAASGYRQRREECLAAVSYFQRFSRQITALRDVSVETARAQVLQMPPIAAARALHVTSEIRRVQAAAEALRRDDLRALGPLMTESHRSLRDDYEASCPEVDRLVEVVAKAPGVIGVRMTGGGFGGCVVAIARRDSRATIEASLRGEYDKPGAAVARVWESRPSAGAAIVSA